MWNFNPELTEIREKGQRGSPEIVSRFPKIISRFPEYISCFPEIFLFPEIVFGFTENISQGL